MTTVGMALVTDAGRLRVALSGPRRQLLLHLRQPASASQLAADLGLPRQRVNYHLRMLEQAGLVELVEERQRRGCVERIMRATADSYLVDPAVLAVDEPTGVTAADTYAAEHLVRVASDTVRQVARMRDSATGEGTRLLTFTIEAEVRFGEPADVHRFTDAVGESLAAVVAAFDTPGGRPYRLMMGGHPAPAGQTGDPQ